MIGLRLIASYIPPARACNFAASTALGVSETMLRDKIGFLSRSVLGETQDTADLACAAVQQLREKAGDLLQRLDCLVVCTQNPGGGGLPHVSSVVHGRLRLDPEVACFDIGLGCSGYIYALSLVSSFMAANGFSSGVIVTADPYSKIVDPTDRNTALLFGDAACATLLTTDALYGLGPFRFGTVGSEGHHLRNEGGKLVMNGRAIFDFAMRTIPKQVDDVLSAARLSRADIDAYAFHQGSKYIVDMLAQRLALSPERVLRGDETVGNTVSSSIPLLLEPLLALDARRPRRILASGFGVGLSSATAVLTRTTNDP
ncbi:MAG TPA: ketoacyl-ACP synthase III [Vicinamibacterales bacterium]|nr:ketoacyl-ACP synthase III [Vicinamibacterales bacterium]